MSTPLVSVILACYKEPLEWFQLAVNSILGQSLADLELIIIVDDPSNEIILSYLEELALTDARIKLIKNDVNCGLPLSLNKGLDIAKGKFIARMDADDIAYIDRFKIQVSFLEENAHVALVGAAIENIDETGLSMGISKYKSDEELINKIIPYCSVACHPTWMFRRELVKLIGGYRELQGVEDYDFLYRTLDSGMSISNINKPLLKYRLHNNSITSNMNLKRYRLRNFVHLMHEERITKGFDTYSEDKVTAHLKLAKDSEKISNLITKLRKAQASGSIMKVWYLAILFFYSIEVRGRILDHIKLKVIVNYYHLLTSKNGKIDATK